MSEQTISTKTCGTLAPGIQRNVSNDECPMMPVCIGADASITLSDVLISGVLSQRMSNDECPMMPVCIGVDVSITLSDVLVSGVLSGTRALREYVSKKYCLHSQKYE